MKTLTKNQLTRLRNHFDKVIREDITSTGDQVDFDNSDCAEVKRLTDLANNLSGFTTISQFCKCAIALSWDLESFARVIGNVLYDINDLSPFGMNGDHAKILAMATRDYDLDPELFTEFDT